MRIIRDVDLSFAKFEDVEIAPGISNIFYDTKDKGAATGQNILLRLAKAVKINLIKVYYQETKCSENLSF